MKNFRINSRYIFVFIFCLLGSCKEYNFDVNIDPSNLNSIALAQAPWRIINLQVDAHELYTNPDNFKKPFVLNQCVISHNENGNTATGPGIKNFESKVKIDGDIVWTISIKPTSTNLGYTAQVEQIQSKNVNAPSVPNFFSRNILGRNSNGHLVNKVRNDNTLVGKKYSYEVMFSIQPPGGGESFYFLIDPKLEARSN